MNRFLLTLTSAAIVATAAAQSPQICSFTVGNDAFVNGMSRNGKWATYQKQAGDDNSIFDVQIIDLSNGKMISYTPQHLIDYRGKESSFVSGSYSQPFGVSDDAKIVYGTVNGYPAYFTVDDLTWHCLSMGSSSDNRTMAGAIYGMSADGTVMSGWFSGSGLTDLKSAVWVNGEAKELSALPTYEDLYKKGIIVKNDYLDQMDRIPSYTFRTLSADGTKMLVGVDHNKPDWGCSYGIYDLENDTFSFILAPADEYGHSFTDSAYLSENGEWATGNIMFVGADINGYDDKEGVFRYHVPTGTIEVFNDQPDQDILATAIDNDGTILASTPTSQPIRNLLVRSGNVWVDLGKILTQKYNVDFTRTTGFDTSGYANNVSADGKTILAQAEFRGGAYALTLPVSFAEAAEGTSLLTEYAVSPAPGKQFANLSQMMVRFNYGAVPVEGAKAVVTDSQGNKAGESTEFRPFSSQNLLYTVVFPDIEMKSGETYTVTIPADSFMVPGTSMGNSEIKVNYLGRDNVAVEPVDFNPTDGSFVNVFSMNAPLKITFDTELTLSTAVQAQLYEDGKSVPLCVLSPTIQGNQLVLYPASERRLQKDHDYTIEVPAGIVADLGGSGFNEAFSLTLRGAYVHEAPKDPTRPFFEDFSSPNDALYKFLLIDGDKQTPSADMTPFGFDAVNTPWNFTIRDDGSYDYCAASHSLYTPAGQSDDWMMLPQIDLQDSDYVLSFKAQSFSQSKADRLRVIVWEYDDVIGSLDDNMLKKVKEEYKTLAEFQVQPSMSEGILAGSWTEYEFPLSDYAGKKVYIAFVNENRNQSMVFVDDICVEYRGIYNMSVETESGLVAAETTDVKAYFHVNAEGPFDTVKATINVPSTDYTKELSFDGLSLTSGSDYMVEFKDVPVELGNMNDFTVTASLGGIEQTYQGQIVNQAFEVKRRVLVEEGTGMWCGNCPLGEVAIEHMEEIMPDDVAVVSVHNDDAFAYSEYDVTLALGGYPMGRVNRSENTFAPMHNSAELGDYAYTSPTGDQTFMDQVLNELANSVEGEIKVTDAVYFSADQVVSVPVSVRFNVSRPNAIYNVYTCVLENELTGYQTNYFANASSNTMGWWAAQPKKVQYTYHNVARALIGGFYGMSGRVPETVVAGEEYVTDVRFDLPSNVSNPDNMHFVVALIDATNGKVVNADVCRTFDVNNEPGASNGVETIEAVTAKMTLVNGTILVNGEADAEVYSMNGMRVRNENLAKGIYLVRKAMSDGSTFNGRILVK